MIIFGQGAICCHPYVLKEMAAHSESSKCCWAVWQSLEATLVLPPATWFGSIWLGPTDGIGLTHQPKMRRNVNNNQNRYSASRT